MNLRLLIPFFDTTAQDWAAEARWLRWLTFLWLLVGLLVMFSASFAIADSELKDGFYYLKLQLAWMAIGIVGFNLLVHFPLRYIVGIADWVLLLLLSFILVTLLPGVGTTVNGATRWLFVGPFPIQPSELIKPF